MRCVRDGAVKVSERRDVRRQLSSSSGSTAWDQEQDPEQQQTWIDRAANQTGAETQAMSAP
jgi:hypothetical protein